MITDQQWRPAAGCDNVWTLRGFESGVCILRSTAFGLPDGSTLVFSPIKETHPNALIHLRSLGRPTILLAPNSFHNMGITTFYEAFTGCEVVASEQARKRVASKTGLAVSAWDTVVDRLPEGLSFLETQGTRTGEVWLRRREGDQVAWWVCDAFFNIPSYPRGLSGCLVRAMTIEPGPHLGRTFRYFAVGDSQAYHDWISAQLSADRPHRVWVAHGDPIDGDNVPERLEDLLKTRF